MSAKQYRVRFYPINLLGRKPGDDKSVECKKLEELLPLRDMIRAMHKDYVVIMERFGRADRIRKVGLIGWHIIGRSELRLGERLSCD